MTPQLGPAAAPDLNLCYHFSRPGSSAGDFFAIKIFSDAGWCRWDLQPVVLLEGELNDPSWAILLQTFSARFI